MLRTLHIRDFVIVDKAEIHFDSGFTVFSGETGAGKSILIDALSLALGARGDTGAIRQGAPRADISAVFDAPAGLAEWLEERELDATDGLILRRTVDPQGRSRAFINGLPVTLGQLRELGEHLVDIHGQHAHQSLLKPAHQRDLLDAQGDCLTLATKVRQAWQAWQTAARALDQAKEQSAVRDAERERLEWQLADLERLKLQPGEWQALTQDHNRLAHAQALVEGSTRAAAALDGDEISVRSLLNQAAQEIRQLLRHDAGLQNIADTLESALIASSEAASDLNHYLTSLELDPESLSHVEQRMSSVFELARKLNTEPDDLPELEASLHEQLSALEQAANIEQLEHNIIKAQTKYQQLATQLSATRQQTADRLAVQVTEAMQTLAMDGGRFDIVLIPCEPGGHGNENVEFLVAGHAGTAPRPLMRVASGGELARLSLALSVIASQAARVPTLIFDEVDTGIGGGVAEVVGRLLRELGDRHQVLCVTHLPQVAACGSHHYEVRKLTRDATAISSITALDHTARVQEIARMLGGLKITETTRRHAEEMLEAS